MGGKSHAGRRTGANEAPYHRRAGQSASSNQDAMRDPWDEDRRRSARTTYAEIRRYVKAYLRFSLKSYRKHLALIYHVQLVPNLRAMAETLDPAASSLHTSSFCCSLREGGRVTFRSRCQPIVKVSVSEDFRSC